MNAYVVYSQRNKLETLMASIAVGVRHLSAIQTRLVPDTTAASLFGMARFPDQAQINAFLQAMGPEQVAHLERAHAALLARHSGAADQAAWVALPDGERLLPVDADQTYLVTRSAQAEGATPGYFGRKRGQYGYKKSLAFLGGGVREVLWQRLEPGNEHGQDAVVPLLAALGALLTAQGTAAAQVLLRGDAQYGSTGSLRQYQATGVHYAVRGYAANTAQALAQGVPADGWRFGKVDSNGAQVWYTDLGVVARRGHDDPPGLAPVRTRVVLVRREREQVRKKRGVGAPGTVTETVVTYEHYDTDLEAEQVPPEAVLALYDGRETEESFFRAERRTPSVRSICGPSIGRGRPRSCGCWQARWTCCAGRSSGCSGTRRCGRYA